MNEPTAISPAEMFSEGTPTAPASQPIQQSQEPSAPPAAPEGGQPWQGGGFQQQAKQEPAATPAQPAAPTITPEMIQMAVQQGAIAAAQAVRQSAPPPPPRAPTADEQAEFDRTFGVVRVTPDMYKQVLGVAPQNEQQVKALESMLHATARQATLMAEYRARQGYEGQLQKMQQTLNTQMAPALDYVSQQRHAQVEQTFLAQNQDLKDFAPLVKEVATATFSQVQNGSLKFNSQAEAFKFVADRARSLLGKAPPSGSPPARQTTQPRRMTPTSLGGSPGSGRPLQPANTGVISPAEVFKQEG